MLKLGQNWGKIANYPPNGQQRFAPLITMTRYRFRYDDLYQYTLYSTYTGIQSQQ